MAYFLSVLNGGIATALQLEDFWYGFSLISIFTDGIIFLLVAFIFMVYLILILKMPLKY
ncbi:hypothetical protein [Methanobrevibacter sp. UBA212]|uniref:hypothetical protein n=1 Tax=Methanobrevibacter sp. UBA212 TaxID=1915476 RepID=UPI0025D9B9A3|nr:hypothetical protein [Methanobrevibacter sp. UBA212]